MRLETVSNRNPRHRTVTEAARAGLKIDCCTPAEGVSNGPPRAEASTPTSAVALRHPCVRAQPASRLAPGTACPLKAQPRVGSRHALPIVWPGTAPRRDRGSPPTSQKALGKSAWIVSMGTAIDSELDAKIMPTT